MVLSLIHPKDLVDAQKIIAVAALAGVKLKLLYIDEGVDNDTLPYRLNCHPLGKVPILKTDEGYLFEANAIVRYLARTESILETKYPHPNYGIPYKLYGKTLQDAGLVDAWIDFACNEIDTVVRPFFDTFGSKKKSASMSVRSRNSTASAVTRAPTKKELQEVVDKLHEALVALNSRLQNRREDMRISECRRQKWMDESSELQDGYSQSVNDDEYDPFLFPGPGGSMSEHMALATPSSRVGGGADDDTFSTGGQTPRSARYRDPSGASANFQIYNVNSRIKSIHRERGSHAQEALRRYGGRSASVSNSAMQTPRTGRTIPGSARSHTITTPTSFVFLVGDSLTAADVVLAFSLLLIFRVPELGKRTQMEFREVYSFYSSIMMLPLVADVRRALGVEMSVV